MATSPDTRPALAYGVSWWSRPQVAAMAGGPLAFTSDLDALADAAAAGGDVYVWASREPVGLETTAKQAGGSVVRIEDGFVRSPGLGALFAPAYSVIFDDVGIYFDAQRPSRLENLLGDSSDFTPELLERAARIRERLVARAIAKYEAGHGERPSTPTGKRRVLVVGQVEDDASIRLGGADVRANLALLEAAREARPDAWIAYKPHPDVLAAGRPGHVAADAILKAADANWAGMPIATALDWADEVHTISSLAGFEALLRRKDVVVYGRPFYAGWGLTQDMAKQPARRQATVSLEALVAAALIVYPSYLDPISGAPTDLEGFLDRIDGGWKDPLIGRPWWHRAASLAKRAYGPLRRRPLRFGGK